MATEQGFSVEEIFGQTPKEREVARTTQPDTLGMFSVIDIFGGEPEQPKPQPEHGMLARIGNLPLRFGTEVVEQIAEGAIQLAQLIPGDIGGLEERFPGGQVEFVKRLEEMGVLFEANAMERIVGGTGRVAAFFAPVNVASKAMLALKVPKLIAAFAPITIGSYAALNSQAKAEGRGVSPREFGTMMAQVGFGVFAGAAGTRAAKHGLDKLMQNKELVETLSHHIGNAALGGVFETMGAAAEGESRERMLEAFVEGTLGAILGSVAANRFPEFGKQKNLPEAERVEIADEAVAEINRTQPHKPLSEVAPIKVEGQKLVEMDRVFTLKNKFNSKTREGMLEEAATVNRRLWRPWLKEQIQRHLGELEALAQPELVKRRIRELAAEGFSVSETVREMATEGLIARGKGSAKRARNIVRAYKAQQRIPTNRDIYRFDTWQKSRFAKLSDEEIRAFDLLPETQRLAPKELATKLDEAIRLTRKAPHVADRLSGAELTARTILSIQEVLKQPPKSRPPVMDPLMAVYQRLSKAGKARITQDLSAKQMAKDFKLTMPQARAAISAAREALGMTPLRPAKKGVTKKTPAKKASRGGVVGGEKARTGEKRTEKTETRTEGKKAKTLGKRATSVKSRSKKGAEQISRRKGESEEGFKKRVGESLEEFFTEKSGKTGRPALPKERLAEVKAKLQKAKNPEEARKIMLEALEAESDIARVRVQKAARKAREGPEEVEVPKAPQKAKKAPRKAAAPKTTKKTLGARKQQEAQKAEQPAPSKKAPRKKAPAKKAAPVEKAPVKAKEPSARELAKKRILDAAKKLKGRADPAEEAGLKKLTESRGKRKAEDLPIAVRRQSSIPENAEPVQRTTRTRSGPASFKTADQAIAFAETYALDHPDIPLVVTYRGGKEPFHVLAGPSGALTSGPGSVFDPGVLRESLAELGVIGAEKMPANKLIAEAIKRLQPTADEAKLMRRAILGEGKKIEGTKVEEAPLQVPERALKQEEFFERRLKESRTAPVEQAIQDSRLSLTKIRAEEAELVARLRQKLTNEERQVVQAELGFVRDRIGIEQQIASDIALRQRKQGKDVTFGSGFGALQALYDVAKIHTQAIKDAGGVKQWLADAKARDNVLKKGLPSRKSKEMQTRELNRAYEAAQPLERHRPPGFWRQAMQPALDILRNHYGVPGKWLAERIESALTFVDGDEGQVLQAMKLVRMPEGWGLSVRGQLSGEKSVLGKSALDRISTKELDNVVEVKDWHVMRLVNENPKKFLGPEYEGGPIEFPGFDPAKPPQFVSKRAEVETAAWIKYYLGEEIPVSGKKVASVRDELVDLYDQIFPMMARRAQEVGIEIATRDANGMVTLHPFQPNLGPNGKFWPYFMWKRAMRPTTDEIGAKKNIFTRLRAEKNFNERVEFADIKEEQIARLEAARKGISPEEVVEVIRNDQRNRLQPYFRYTLESQAKRAGHLELSRKLEGLLGGVVSPSEIIPLYVRPGLLRIRYVEQFGHGGGKANRVIENLARRGFDAQAAKHLFELSMEQIPEAMDSTRSPAMIRELAGAATVSLLNWSGVTQLTSAVPVFRAARTSDNPFAPQNYRGFFKSMTQAIRKSYVDLGLSKRQVDVIEAMRLASTGAPLEGERVNWQMANRGVMQRAAGIALHLHGLVPIDRFLRNFSAAWGRNRADVFGEEYVNALARGDAKRLRALDEKLSWFRFMKWDHMGKRVRPEQDFRNWHKLDPQRQEFYRNIIGHTVARRTQMRTRFADLPPLANDPFLRPIFKFSQFAIRATHETFRQIRDEIIERQDVGKVSATLRYLASLVPAGVAALYIQEVRSIMMEPNKEKRRERAMRTPLWQQFTYRVAFANHLPWYIDWVNAAARERGLSSRIMGPVYGQLLDVSEYAMPALFKGDPGPLARYMMRTYGPVPFYGGPTGSPFGRLVGFPSGREVLEGKPMPFGMGHVQTWPAIGPFLRPKSPVEGKIRSSDLGQTMLPVIEQPAARVFLPAQRAERRRRSLGGEIRQPSVQEKKRKRVLGQR